MINQENLITRTQLCLKMGSLDQLYQIYDIEAPGPAVVAQYLVNQFEHADFDFGCIEKEEEFQDQFENLMREHLKQWGGPEGLRLAVRMQRAMEEDDRRPKEDKLQEERPMLA